MSVWINFWPGFEKLRYALASCHPAIILQGGYRFQSAFEINARNARPYRAVRSESDLFWRRRGRRRTGLRIRDFSIGRCYRAHLLSACLFETTLLFYGSVFCSPAFSSCSSIQQGAVTNEGLKFGRKLLYSFFSFSFRLRGIGRLALTCSFPLFCKPCRVHLRGVGNQRTKLRRELL